MIELRHFRYFVAVAEEGHVTRAAERLGIQQPPLSQQIRVLEREVGAQLFRRLPRGVELTDAGRTLLEKVRLVLADVDLALDAARRTARGEQGGLVIGFTSSAAFHPLVASVVRLLRQTVPGVTLALREGNTSDLIGELRSERLDAAFVRSPVERPVGLVVEPLLAEEMLVALPDQHAIAERLAKRSGQGMLEGRIALAELAQETFILYRRPSGPGLYDSIIAACRAAGFSPRIGQEAPQMVSTLSLVAAGLGVSIIPASMARLETNGIAYARLDDLPRLTAPLHLAYREEKPSGALERFIDCVRRSGDVI
ncbi:LysR family transcriptional regulator [Bosea psychrotolerans]|uniref:DNA-binding transcriptional LysR family regulator n=1 Tax=Bosea psychrotolerans TaxID=1871628 RepID=A0A2S4M2T0_9HYPH|nr:LysR family transcriptional regulator [Bosea psychrotolerans]POR48889.1 DNA-binding transcriptional LysR family regulator [Bosea psychrotolerans]